MEDGGRDPNDVCGGRPRGVLLGREWRVVSGLRGAQCPDSMFSVRVQPPGKLGGTATTGKDIDALTRSLTLRDFGPGGIRR